MKLFEVHLNGCFRLLNEAGQDVTPVSQKHQAVIALLALSPGMKRTRSWLQDKLWADKGPTRGGASLRQALTALRKLFGADADVLQTPNKSVGLDPDKVQVVWSGESCERDGIFLEGIDIREQEFNDWLNVIRGTENTAPAPSRVLLPTQRSQFEPPQKWKLYLAGSEQTSPRLAQFERQFIALVVDSFVENYQIEIAYQRPPADDPFVLIAEVNAFELDQRDYRLHVKTNDPISNRVFWSEAAKMPCTLTTKDNYFDLVALSYRLQSAIMQEIVRQAQNGQISGANELTVAIPKIFTFSRDGLSEAERLLADCGDQRLSGIAAGWRAQIAVINLIEKFTTDPVDCIEKGRLLATEALEADPMNSTVLSTAANARILLDWDVASGAELAELAIQVGPNNPMAWWAISNVALYNKLPEKALEAANTAKRLTARSPLQFWSEFQLGLAAMQSGDFETAIQALSTSAALAPSFRPPRRYLLALYSHQNRTRSAQQVLRQLMALESNFSLDALTRDPEYPISLARDLDIIDAHALSQLSLQ